MFIQQLNSTTMRLEISTELGNKLCSLFHRGKAVCPPRLKCSLFTTAAVDNIDHNPSSTSSHDAFHGTCISLFQRPDSDNSGVPQVVTATSDSVTSYAHLLPDNHTSIPAVPPQTKTLLYLYKKVQTLLSAHLYHMPWRTNISEVLWNVN